MVPARSIADRLSSQWALVRGKLRKKWYWLPLSFFIWYATYSTQDFVFRSINRSISEHVRSPEVRAAMVRAITSVQGIVGHPITLAVFIFLGVLAALFIHAYVTVRSSMPAETEAAGLGESQPGPSRPEIDDALPIDQESVLRQDCLNLSAEILSFVTEERKLPEQDLFGVEFTGIARVIRSTAHSYRLRFEESVRLMAERLEEAGIRDERLSRYTEKPPADIYEVEALGGLLRTLAGARMIYKVTDTTLEQPEKRGDRIYASLVRAATEGLHLAAWDSISDNALRGMLSDSFVEGANEFSRQVFRTVWPGTRPKFESEVKNLSGRVDAYLGHFMKRAHAGNDGIWSEDRSWKRQWVSQSEFEKRIAESEAWETRCSKLLWNVVVALNFFAEAVREGLDPDFFLLRGKFVISDSLGVANRFNPAVYLPGKYRD